MVRPEFDSIRVEKFVRECQRFAGESSLATSRDEHLLLVRNFVERLPDPANRMEALIFRSMLVDVASKWARHIHRRVHGRESGQAERLFLLDTMTSCCADGTASDKWLFERWATASLEEVDRADLLSPAARAKKIIDTRFAEAFRLKALGRMTGCTAARLRVLFRQEFGMSLREYRTRVRVLNAAKRITDSDVKIESIAVSSGFRSRRNFYSAFRRLTGCTPSAMRRRSNQGTVPVLMHFQNQDLVSRDDSRWPAPLIRHAHHESLS
jgi:AraC-like DNA-binding protein